MAPHTDFRFRDGRCIADAVAQAGAADVAVVFVRQCVRRRGCTSQDLSLPKGQDALIEAVARASPNTIVVLETGGAILMP